MLAEEFPDDFGCAEIMACLSTGSFGNEKVRFV
jgi:hypothetical protein